MMEPSEVAREARGAGRACAPPLLPLPLATRPSAKKKETVLGRAGAQKKRLIFLSSRRHAGSAVEKGAADGQEQRREDIDAVHHLRELHRARDHPPWIHAGMHTCLRGRRWVTPGP